MEIKIEDLGGVTIVTIAGRLDSLTAPKLETSVVDLISASSRLVLNLQAVEYVSSAGLRAFLMIAKTSNRNDCEFVICSVRPDIADVIEMSGFNSILRIKNSLDEALGRATD